MGEAEALALIDPELRQAARAMLAQKIPPMSREALPAILRIHGGGMISGRARNMTAFSQSLSAEFGAVVVNVDYRLAPETPYPGPVLDNYAALEWMAANAAILGIDPARIAVMSESAGGGLAAMVALMARDRGKVPLCQAVLIYPMLDDRTGSTRNTPHLGAVRKLRQIEKASASIANGAEIFAGFQRRHLRRP